MRQAILDRSARLRQPLLPGAAGTHLRPSGALALVAGAFSGVAAAIHAAAIGPHLEESRLFGAAFAGMAVAQAGWMLMVFVGQSRRRYLAGAALNGAVVLTWLLSRTVGLPLGPHPGVAEPIGPMDAVATLAEVLAVLGSLALARRMRGASSRAVPPGTSAPLRVGFALLAAGFVATVIPESSPAAHGAGSHPWWGTGLVGHLVILTGMLTALAGVLVVAVRGGTRPSRGRRTS